MLRSLTVLMTVASLLLLDMSYARATTRAFKCPCTFSVSREMVPSTNEEPFDVLVEPLFPTHRSPGMRGTNTIEKHSSRNLQVKDAIHTASGYHHFHNMSIIDDGLFRVRIRHHSTRQTEADPDYNLDLHTSARQVVCPVILAPDQPLTTLSRSAQQFVQDTVRMNSLGDSRIVGGLFISPTLLPYLVTLQTPVLCPDGTPGCRSDCTGTILSGKWIMTAAHCNVEVGSLVIVTTRNIRFGSFTRVVRAIPHPNYLGFNNFFDIAVHEIGADITGCCDVTPQFMPISFDSRFPRSQSFVRAAGYGRTSDDGSVPEPVRGLLRQVDVPVIRNELCRNGNDPIYRNVSSTFQVCAGYFQGGGCDSCFGDSGGPLVQYDGSTPVLIGITSFGSGCARPGAPGVYTRPSGDAEWLRSTGAVFTIHEGVPRQVRVKCRRGEFIPFVEGEISECAPCPDDQFSSGGTIRQCEQCPGNLLRDTRNGRRCSCRRIPGFGRKRGALSCLECPPGFASDVGVAKCLKCRPGSFAPTAGMSQCLPCEVAPRGARVCEVKKPESTP